MKFLRMYNSSAANEIGFFPQIHNAILDFNIHDENSYYNLEKRKSNANTLWPKLKISGRAKKTDFISVSFMGIHNIFSNKLKLIFEKFLIEGVEFISTELILRNKNEDQFWIPNIYDLKYNFIDLKKSEFVYTNCYGSEIIEEAVFLSIKDLLSALEKNKKDAIEIGYPNFKPLFFKNIYIKEDCEIDFFTLERVYGGYGYFVSERLKDAILNELCTGIVFTETNEKYP